MERRRQRTLHNTFPVQADKSFPSIKCTQALQLAALLIVKIFLSLCQLCFFYVFSWDNDRRHIFRLLSLLFDVISPSSPFIWSDVL
mmetsp:Transcript_15807/g.61636  ORF Transcript_15807/g.61636 Transcript_15807/m.61636 type:complete len:86 (-) Transcript_15807:252-509(-)